MDLVHNANNSLSMIDQQLTSCIDQSKANIEKRLQGKCPYSWTIINQKNSLFDFDNQSKCTIASPAQLQKVIDEILIQNDGWTLLETWIDKSRNAKFTAKMHIEGLIDRLLTLRLSARKSFSANSVALMHLVGYSNATTDDYYIENIAGMQNLKNYTISAHSKYSPTTYYMDYSLDLPKLFCVADNKTNTTSTTIIMQIKLISGAHFQILAMSFCY